uniref:Lysozyme n=1 Tax=Sciurus vulgaris TaxID=55149 RepID=A0A8D2JFU7_SCIVU
IRSILIISLFSCFFAAFKARVFTKCELAQKTKAQGMNGFHGYSLAVFSAEYENNFNTQAFHEKNAEGSNDYGLFQLNNLWCEDKDSSENGCNVLCKFVDEDIDDNILYAKKVVKNPKGMSTCLSKKSKDLSKYLSTCKL